MKLNEIHNLFKKYSNINTLYGDVYENLVDEVEYPLINVSISTETIKENSMTYNVLIFYVDKLATDSNNVYDVQSDGIYKIKTLLNTINNNTDLKIDIPYTIANFTATFGDNCGGVYTNISMTTSDELGECEE